jgi:hypothetical protein
VLFPVLKLFVLALLKVKLAKQNVNVRCLEKCKHGLKKRVNINGIWFQQDGATPHTERASNNLLLRKIFAGLLISRFGDVPWPPRSSNFLASDYILWGYVKTARV